MASSLLAIASNTIAKSPTDLDVRVGMHTTLSSILLPLYACANIPARQVERRLTKQRRRSTRRQNTDVANGYW